MEGLCGVCVCVRVHVCTCACVYVYVCVREHVHEESSPSSCTQPHMYLQVLVHVPGGLLPIVDRLYCCIGPPSQVPSTKHAGLAGGHGLWINLWCAPTGEVQWLHCFQYCMWREWERVRGGRVWRKEGGGQGKGLQEGEGEMREENQVCMCV